MISGTYIIAAAAIVVVLLLIALLARKGGGEKAEGGKEAAYANAVGCLIDGNRNEALKHLKEAVRLNPENIHAYIKLGDLLREKGEIDRATQIHRELTVRRTRAGRMDKELYRSLAKDYLAAGKFAEAKTAAEKSLSFDKRSEEGLAVLAHVYEGAGDLEKAYEVQTELAKRGKNGGGEFLALYKSHIGSRYLAAGDKSRAKKSFEAALNIDKKCLPALLYLGDMFYGDGHRKKATERWVELTELYPQWAYIVYGRLEKAYYESGAFGDIEQVYENVLRARPNDIPTLLAMAEINQKRGVFDEAMRLVKETLELDPDCRRARQLLVRLRLEKGDAEDALQDVLSFLEESRLGEGEFVCRDCGHRSTEVLFRCPGCSNWNTYLH
jgi:lipopolysaccharide biosynthesis regulator YciM